MVEQRVDVVGERVEGVVELVDAGQLGVAEARVVRGDDVVAVGQRGDQVAVHVRAGGRAVQQDDGGRVRRPGLAVEDPAAGDLGVAVVCRSCLTPMSRFGGYVESTALAT